MRPTATAAAAVSISIDTSQTSINRDREMCVARTTDEATQQYNRGGRIKMVADNLSFNTGILNHEWRRRVGHHKEQPINVTPSPRPKHKTAFTKRKKKVKLSNNISSSRTSIKFFGFHVDCFQRIPT